MGMKSALVLATAGLALVAGSVQAFTENLGKISDRQVSYTLPKGSSADIVKFSLTSAADFDFEVYTSSQSGGPITGSFDLYDSNLPNPLLASVPLLSGQPPSFTSIDLSKGNYYFLFSPYAAKPVADPTLHLNLSVSAVPEPQTYAMMLAGLAVVGVSVLRRRNLRDWTTSLA